jgi:hypothetical protein
MERGVRLGLPRPHDTSVIANCVYGSIRQFLYRHVVVQAEPNADLHAATTEVVVSSPPAVLRT